MRLIALGTSAAYPGPGNACTGWLVQEQGVNLLVDCGSGVLSHVQRVVPLTDLTAVVVSHMHADHWLDLIPLRYAFKYALRPGVRDFPVYLPPGGEAFARRLTAPYGSEEGADFFAGVFALREYDPAAELRVGPLRLRFAPGVHYIPCWGISVEAAGRRAVFTADTGPSHAITDLARGADLLVCEATYLSLEEDAGPQRGHLTAREAGELAAQATPRRMLLTHLWPNRDARETLAQARHAFSGDLALAEHGRAYEV
ncbi:MAG: MBL fold metallo-hydrolase [Chloroflexi bacterium]|nr:MBL fold metallo-hydrolase [Chloroflexota bacterium]